MKSEIYFQAGNFDVSPSITIDETTDIEKIALAFGNKRDDLLAKYSKQFEDKTIKDRLIFWKERLEKSIVSGWSEDAKKYFIGKRLLKDIQSSVFGTKTISIWEHILNSNESECLNTVKSLRELVEKI